MSDTAIIACPKCGQRLGIPSHLETVHVTCPKCMHGWDWPLGNSSGSSVADGAGRTPPRAQETRRSPLRRASPRRGWLVAAGAAGAVLLGLLALAVYHLLTYLPPQPLPGREANRSESRRPVWNPPPEEPLPDNGDGVFRFDRSAAASKLRIVPRGEQGHLVVKVEEATAAKLVCWVFIRQGQAAEITIPEGTYRLKLACGQKWYGERQLFGPGASYSAIANEITVPIHTAYTIDLHPNAVGTLREEKLSSEDF